MTKHGFQSQIAFNSWRLSVTSQSQGVAKWDTECLVSWCNQNDRWSHQDLVPTSTPMRNEGGRSRQRLLWSSSLAAENMEGNSSTSLSSTWATDSQILFLRGWTWLAVTCLEVQCPFHKRPQNKGTRLKPSRAAIFFLITFLSQVGLL